MSEYDKTALIKAAFEVRKNAYAPYSGYYVGAALLTESGKIFTGTNVENSSFPVGVCAERSAFAAAISSGERKFIAMCVTVKETIIIRSLAMIIVCRAECAASL